MYLVLHLLRQYGILVVFAGVLAEQLGFPLPSWPLLIAAGAMAAVSVLDLAVLIVVAAAAAISADLIWYEASLKVGYKPVERIYRLMPSPEACKRRTEDIFAQLGPWALPVAKFVPFASTFVVALSGVTRMTMTRFLIFDASGAILYVAIPITLGAISGTR